MTVPRDEPCPTCGRENPREVYERRMSQMRARSQLMTSLAKENLTTQEVCEVLAGVRPVAEVLAARDARLAPHNEGDQQ